MKTYTEYLWFNTKERREIIHITKQVEDIIKKSGIKDGFCLVSSMHTTASVFVNDNESGLHRDLLEVLDMIAPPEKDWRHNATGEDNGNAHIKSMLMNHQVFIPISNGRFDAGPWQRIFYGEWDGQRKKGVLVKVVGI
ncbi:MAG: secondary thiamine-phosphate synthase enzyme YjbQ [Candidatus Woesearchaeota archaeon]